MLQCSEHTFNLLLVLYSGMKISTLLQKQKRGKEGFLLSEFCPSLINILGHNEPPTHQSTSPPVKDEW